MLPIRGTIQSRNYPVVNIALIVTNVLVYLVQLTYGDALNRFILVYGLVPVRYSVPEIGIQFTFFQQKFAFLSFMFIHGGFLHLLGNMWTLYIFGDNIEDRLGPARYLAFYLLCGLASGLIHLFFNWDSRIPTVGASGAIAGIMGAYFILYPKSKILTLIPVFIIPFFFELPAYVFLGIWFLIQALSAVGSSGQMGGIAWWAHIGGFVAGVLLLRLFLKVPATGITQEIRRKTFRQKTPRLQVIRTSGNEADYHLYGTISISRREAFLGTRKLVNIPWGFQKRMFRVTIPPGSTERTTLRLVGMGKQGPENQKGDLLLKVVIQQ